MLVFSRSSMLLFCMALFLLAPKIDVVSVLRVEDFVFLAVLPVLAWRYAPSRTMPPKVLYWYIAYLLLASFSALLNYSNLGMFGFLNVLRQMQYAVWFVVGAQMAAAIPEERFKRVMAIVAGALILWWLGEASGAIPKIGKFTGATGRVTLNTSGPYEISVVVVFLMLLVRKKILLLGLLGILLASQSRITLAAAVFTFLVFRPRQALIFGLPLAVILAVVLMINPEILSSSRLAETMSPLQMWRGFISQFQTAPLIVELPDYRHYAYDTIWAQVRDASDVSFEIRLVRWTLIIKSLSGDLFHLLFGWGPGAWGAAVDSHLIRFSGEVGVIGLFIIATFMGMSTVSSTVPKEFRAAMLVLIICSLFIDVMTSSKIMSLLWMMLGYLYVRRQPMPPR